MTQKSFHQENIKEENLQLVNTLQKEKMNKDALYELEKVMELDHERLNVAKGFHLTGSKGKHVAISLYSSLHIIFHEINHELTEDILGEIHSKIFFRTFKEKVFLKSIFSENNPSWENTLEIFNDYIASQSLKSLSKFDIEHWDYLVQESGFYTKFFPLVEVLIESFDFFMRYAIICHRPKMIECVLRSDHFKEYIALFSIFQKSTKKEQIDEAVLKAKEIIKKMKSQAQNYQPTYFQEVNTYLKELEDNERVFLKLLKKGVFSMKRRVVML